MAQRPSDTSTHSGSARRAISRSMTAEEILPLLSDHGCEDITDQLCQVGPPICNGGFGNVHQGALRHGEQVAVKCLRMPGIHDSNDKQLKFAAHELYVWSKCRHRNVLKLLGVAIYDNQIAMVSPWMANGDMPTYLSNYPETDRYDLCSQVADAVAYLKSHNMVHGDIKGANVLVSEEHVPKLTDFGTSALTNYTLAFTAANWSQLGISVRWAAPEMLEGKQGFESDVYALGMTILEAFVGSVPYASLTDLAVIARLMQKIPPERPQECMGGEFPDALWNLLTKSWDAVPENRPMAQSVRNTLMAMMGPTDVDNRVELAAKLLFYHRISGSSNPFEIISLLNEDSISQLDMSKVGPAIGTGGFGDVHSGALKNGDRVSIKCLRMLGANDSDDKKLKVPPASGLIAHINSDLPTNTKVHGDIKGANVLVSEDHVPKLTDFGTSTLSKYTLAFTETQPYLVLRWTAPEIFIEGKAHTFDSDVYALGMTILEAFTGSVPYASFTVGEYDTKF
ncbi:Proto-oncogene tyrosine-protein kinase ROS [Rhizoctonia solani]|uniref:Proto-oncogene tyrosine-protein kinase ROS n=1 Tax=Rhizoctonia solani TaxID=456999 RepID=A0A0K6FZB5_9AGAM|nr:Proto-oncogene tyrosine-protein kinase ROS [Rhizoctonia solani]